MYEHHYYRRIVLWLITADNDLFYERNVFIQFNSVLYDHLPESLNKST